MTLSGLRGHLGQFTGRHFVFVVNVDWFFESHRLPIASRLLDLGADVTLVAGLTGRETALRQAGLNVVPVNFTRSQKSIPELASSILYLRRTFEGLDPDLVHNVTVKPVIAGSIAAVLHDPRLPVVNAISGFGHLLSDTESGRIVQNLTRLAYLVALRAPRRTRAIVQNEAALGKVEGRLARSGSVAMIPGMGVSPTEFVPGTRRATESPPVVMLASRMIASKGIREFVAAARTLRREWPHVRFVLVGPPDPGNPLSYNEEQLVRLSAEHAIEWWGPSRDMACTLQSADIFVLPTHHEGLPKVLLEAAATGLAIVTTDIPGCRQVVRDQREALLVPPGDEVALGNAISGLLADPALRARLGRAARARVLHAFTVEHAVDAHLQVYGQLL